MVSKTRHSTVRTRKPPNAGKRSASRKKRSQTRLITSPDIYIPPTTHLAQIEALALMPAKDRNSEEASELARLNAKWTEAGGRILFFSDAPLPDIFEILKSGSRIMVEGRCSRLQSPLWGKIDLTNLNKYPSHYFGNLGQTQLARDLSIVANRLSIDLQRFTSALIPKESKRGERRAALKERKWSKLSIDWRRMMYFFLLGTNARFWDQFVDDVGYDQFALDYFRGCSKKAWLVTSSLFDADTFAALKWGKEKHTNVSEQAGIRAAFIEGIETGKYIGKKGYDQFALDYYKGNSKKARLVASSLLDKDTFAALGWGKEKQTNVYEQDGIRASLMNGIETGTYVAEAGYDRFALEFFQGNSRKAWQVASSLLDADTFAALRWGKMKKTMVQDQDGLRDELIQGLIDEIYTGEDGYDKFALDHYYGDSQKAWRNASLLLDKETFAALGWGKVKYTMVQDQDGLRDELIQGLMDEIYIGEDGYDRFALGFVQGCSKKAWLIASSLLDADTFAALGWGKMKKTMVQDQDGLRDELIQGLVDEIYISNDGYDRFALEFFQGDSQRAWLIASSLLDADTFAALKWGKMKITMVQDQDGLRDELIQGLVDEIYVGEAGYDLFAVEYFQGSSNKAWHVASSLLHADTFAALEWGKQKYTNVSEQAGIKAALIQGIKTKTYVCEQGYDQFALDRYKGNSKIAWQIASALLDAETFATLGWRKQKITNVSEQNAIRKALKGTNYIGRTGRMRFSVTFLSGNFKKAYEVARTLLDPADYRRLQWKCRDTLSPEDRKKITSMLKTHVLKKGGGVSSATPSVFSDLNYGSNMIASCTPYSDTFSVYPPGMIGSIIMPIMLPAVSTATMFAV